jgi:hypothetical protein
MRLKVARVEGEDFEGKGEKQNDEKIILTLARPFGIRVYAKQFNVNTL